MDWLKSDPGAPVKCPHCGHRFCDAGPDTVAQVRKGSHEVPPGASIIKCNSCRMYYQYWPRPLRVA